MKKKYPKLLAIEIHKRPCHWLFLHGISYCKHNEPYIEWWGFRFLWFGVRILKLLAYKQTEEST